MKARFLMLTLLFVNYFAIAQVDTVFWNSKMMKLAESNSMKGWVKIQSNKQYDSKTFFVVNKEAFGLNNDDKMMLISSHTDNLGFTHYRFQQTYKGVKKLKAND